MDALEIIIVVSTIQSAAFNCVQTPPLWYLNLFGYPNTIVPVTSLD